jgi:HdeA/HdeB family
MGVLERIAAAALLASTALLLSAEADQKIPWRQKFEINELTCGEFTAVAQRDVQERVLSYMNGYLDGTRKATTWDAELVGKRIDEVMRVCTANPKSTLLEVFERAWAR